ncbi:uncharacterized protein EV420DRAFT_1637895 [Desarmillaria tabescens]|uniref:Fucose-specific lectin n=1 Tax=Armillaria tabescens TaxID=1929756 RepID=A0AA39U068_ARMTA|nr:uncharacterized protein EV420DRAFT_1637895 [Desarmillaria tabescens]KAK0464325.1 hypothetical protein EV420DRAFT_1637895 [Desarmillaria tabescens]
MSFQPNTSAQPSRPAPIVGNFFAAVYGAPSFDYVYCLIAQPAETTPSIVTLRRTDSSDTTSQISSFSSGYGHRDSKIAANRRDFSEPSQQSSVFYQGYNGNLFEWRIDKNGGRAHIGVNTVPETTSGSAIAPVMGSSLASVTTGQDYQTAFLFYQALDNRIYYVYQKAFGQWSIPSLVTYDPAMPRTTLSAFSWTETDAYTGTDTVDCVCVMYNQAPGRYFEPVSGFNGPVMRGPFATVHTGVQNSVDNQYRLFSQPQEDPSRLFQGQVSQGGNFLDMSLVPNTTGVRTPARGTSIAVVYDPSNTDNTKRSIRVFYSTSEGRLLYSTMYDDSDLYNSLQHGELQRSS